VAPASGLTGSGSRGLDHPLPSKPTSVVAYVASFLGKTLTIGEWEVRKLRHDMTDVVTRTV
jgi:hypothetical protein